MLPTIYDGSGKPAPTQITLRAGALSVVYENGLLRYIHLGDQEVLRGIYAAVRDQNWGTIPGQLTEVKMDIRADSFEITFTSDHKQGDVHFVWHGAIMGGSEGRIRFTFEGTSLSAFRRNRIGFCVLHPWTLAGTGCLVEHVDGECEKSRFPAQIAPQQPIHNIRTITHEVLPKVRVAVRMDGDAFEMEDQRNWTDASYKTYCTPLDQPYPVEVAAGTVIRQAVTVEVIGRPPMISVADNQPTLEINTESTLRLPPIGLSLMPSGDLLSAREIELLKALHLAHLRVDLQFDDGMEDRLRQAVTEASALGCKLELALHLGDHADAELRRVQAVVDPLQVPVARWLILRAGAKSTPSETIALARHALGSLGVPIGAGTNGYFTQVNREHPPVNLVDVLVYGLNPQVHAFDNTSLIETLAIQTSTVESARAFSGGAQIAVSPVTLKIGWNPDATSTEAPLPADELPGQVDVRQSSLFGACWTLGSLKALAVADSVTYFETVGWLGVMERESGSPLPEKFPSVAGGAFPMYHVFADVGTFAGGEVLSSISNDPLHFDGLVLRKDDDLRVLVANYTPEPRSVRISGISGRFSARSLDETSADAAICTPESFRASPGSLIDAGNSNLTIALYPYSVLCLDQV